MTSSATSGWHLSKIEKRTKYRLRWLLVHQLVGFLFEHFCVRKGDMIFQLVHQGNRSKLIANDNQVII